MIASYVSGISTDTNELVTGYLIECPDKLPETMHDKKDINMKTFVMMPDKNMDTCEIYPDSKEFIGFFNAFAGSYHRVDEGVDE